MAPRTAVVTGMIGTFPLGGVAWDYAQYVLGLERLGFDVYYLEDTGGHAYDPRTGLYTQDTEYAARFLDDVWRALSPRMADRWHYVAANLTPVGVARHAMHEVIARADILLNVSGGLVMRDEYLRAPRKVLLDTDPGWNHFVQYVRPASEFGLSDTFCLHDYYFTYAERIGRHGCRLPSHGLEWQPTRPPAVMDCWQSDEGGDRWTTVMTWNNYADAIEHDGQTYGAKEVEFDRFKRLPGLVRAPLEIAAGGVRPPLEDWRRHGWHTRSAQDVSLTTDDYRRYIHRSRGEFSVAKNVYVATRSGWFSCRSVCYLAAGRPVVVQDTGFSEFIPTGEGLFAVDDVADAARAITAVEADYERHSAAARQLAAECFDSDRVLADLLERCGIS